MKKFFVILYFMIFSLSISTVMAVNADPKNSVSENKENKLSEEEVNRLMRRVEEIRDMDKSKLTLKEKRALRKELKVIKEKVRKDIGYVYIGTGTLVLIIIILLLLI